MSLKMYMTKGLPACGKTTWARERVETDRKSGIHTKNVCKDDIREMLDFSHWSRYSEKIVIRVRDAIINECLSSRCNVIVSDTNLVKVHEENLRKMAKHHGASFEVVDFTDVSVSECLERDRKRGNKVGPGVIMKMFNDHLKKENDVEMIEYDPNIPDAIIVDVDGTIAIRGERSPFDYYKVMEDTPNQPVIDLVKMLQQNFKVIIMTGRENIAVGDAKVATLTRQWVERHGIIVEDLFIRAMGDHRPDWVVKKELFEQNVLGQFNVKWILDDRAQVISMWRELGATVLDVAGHTF